MVASGSVAQRLGGVLERVTRQSGRLAEPSDFGSLLLGRASESPARRRVRIQVILTTFIVIANLLGVGVAILLVTVAFPVPSVVSDAPAWLTFGVVPAYIVAALIVGVIWVTRRGVNALRWAIEERPPTAEDQRNTFVAPWRLTVVQLILWGVGTVLLTTLYGLVNRAAAPVRRGHHGPDHDGVDARLGCPDAGHRARRRIRTLAAHIELGGEERHVAVLFVDVTGSTQLVASRPPMEVVELLNRFFGVIVEEVDRHSGLVNKFEGDATLAVFGAPVRLDRPEDEALAAARTIARRLRDEVPECPAGLGVAAGSVVAGNVGAAERFEYTVIGDPVHEAARLSELAKSTPERLLASSPAAEAASESERAHWELDDAVVLRGRDNPTRLAKPTDC